MNFIEQEDSRTHTIIVKTWKIIVNFKDDEEKNFINVLPYSGINVS